MDKIKHLLETDLDEWMWRSREADQRLVLKVYRQQHNRNRWRLEVIVIADLAPIVRSQSIAFLLESEIVPSEIVDEIMVWIDERIGVTA